MKNSPRENNGKFWPDFFTLTGETENASSTHGTGTSEGKQRERHTVTGGTQSNRLIIRNGSVNTSLQSRTSCISGHGHGKLYSVCFLVFALGSTGIHSLLSLHINEVKMPYISKWQLPACRLILWSSGLMSAPYHVSRELPASPTSSSLVLWHRWVYETFLIKKWSIF